MRSRKLKHLEERFDWYAPVIEADPALARGTWKERRMPHAQAIELDLGCGKGVYTLRAAHAAPDTLIVGMDREKACVAMAAKRGLADQTPNVVYACGDAEDLPQFFAPGELSCIHINFCTPWPPAKYARRRLTHVEHLMRYRDLLEPDGTIVFKTDSMPLFEFSITQFELAGYRMLWQSHDLQADRPQEVASDYEERLVAKGAKVLALAATPGPRPDSWEQTAELSLAAYLPEDLDSLEYIPYGMETTVLNFKNRQAKLQAKEKAGHQAGHKNDADTDDLAVRKTQQAPGHETDQPVK